MELLILRQGGTTYKLSEGGRTYSRGNVFVGSVSRAISGKLNIRQRARKTTHSITWPMLTYDTMPDGGMGLAELEGLVYSGLVYDLEVNRYSVSGDWPEEFQVMFDPESFSQSLVKLRGHGRRFWNVSVTLLEV